MLKTRPVLLGSLLVISVCLAFLGYKAATADHAPKEYHRGTTLKG